MRSIREETDHLVLLWPSVKDSGSPFPTTGAAVMLAAQDWGERPLTSQT